MRATASCMSKGFWSRSLDEFKRLSNFAFKLEGIKGPSGPLPLHDFHSRESLTACKTLCDQDIGGYSQVALDWVPHSKATAPAPPAAGAAAGEAAQAGGYARFHGNISLALPPGKPDVQRSGYAAWRTLDKPPTLFGKSLFNIDMYAYLALRVRSDGRSYLVNVQTESVVPTDLHQHRLFAKRPGKWETILIKWNDFVRTNHGFVVEPQTEMLRQKVRTIGIGLTDRVGGPFNLCIERIWATNNMSDGDEIVEAPAAAAVDMKKSLPPNNTTVSTTPPEIIKEGQLKNKQGKHIHWE
ncbi:complex I intermediate-associated protein 30 [Nemania sp. FL0916]|nr:complex I intermediate-associated protein 30 [Nemania sp. FL0916]